MIDRKETIIDCATRLFAEHGLDNVTVRQICARAKVNIAMVNYHFTNKEGLYRACLARVFHKSQGESFRTLCDGVCDAKSWREAVRRWVVGFAEAMHATTGGAALAAGLFRQEVSHPSSERTFIAREYVEPTRDILKRLLSMALKDEREVLHWTTSIWAQLSASAMVDPAWQPLFRPKKVSPAAWGAEFADFVCARIFKELKYRGR